MDVSVTGGNDANATPTTQLSGNEVPSDAGTTVAPTSGTTEPTTTIVPTTTAAPTTTTTVDNISTTATTTTTREQPISTTTSNDVRPITTTTTTFEQPESTSNRQSNTNGFPGRTTSLETSSPIRLTSSVVSSTTIPASTTVTRAVTRSSAVPIVSVSSSGSVVRTITSTSYSAYVTNEPTSIPYDPSTNSSSSSNAGPIAGGVVGGVAGLALIGAIAFILMKRRKSKKTQTANLYTDEPMDSGGKHAISPPQEYNNYYENGSQYTGPTNVTGTMSSQATKPRPFVQAYEPVNTTNSPYYYNNNGYDPYYPPQQNIMMNHTGDRHVPDEIDYDTTTTSSGRRMSRHVPNEV
ncbi:hypothetical protein EDC96DRAFT_564471 [Choanephora cucurbitarum]|nr:hypothetical protein EDC96DRAFT_564471 [Choanephora cucurbitarum]